MTRLFRIAPACAFASLLLLAAGNAWPQADAAASSGDTPGAPSNPGDSAPGAGNSSGDAATAPSTPATLPGVVLERNVFVPVDSAGHPTSNQFIVVERRVLLPKQSSGSSDDPASGAQAVPDPPTRFILVPEDSGDGDSGSGSDGAAR